MSTLPQLERELRSAAARRARTRPRWLPRSRWMVSAGAVAAAALAALAFLPADEAPPGSGRATSLLSAVAAVAAERPADSNFDGYRYTRIRFRMTQRVSAPTCPQNNGCPWKLLGKVTEEQTWEQWLDADWSGRVERAPARLLDVSGTPRFVASVRRKPGLPAGREKLRPHMLGSLQRVPLAELPTDPDALTARLTRVYRDEHWAPGLPTRDQQRYDLIRLAVSLIGEANATPALRSAGFELLARMDGARALGRVRDDIGREGEGVELRVHGNRGGKFGPDTIVRIVFDPDTSALLQFSDRIGTGPDPSGETRIYLESARVPGLGDRP